MIRVKDSVSLGPQGPLTYIIKSFDEFFGMGIGSFSEQATWFRV